MNNKQQKVADIIIQYQDAFIIGALNAYELAGKLLDAIEDAEFRADHDCKLDQWGTGHCEHSSHDFDLVNNESAQTDSEALRLATT